MKPGRHSNKKHQSNQQQLPTFKDKLHMAKRIVIPNGYGQMCNQILQICHWVPISLEKGIPIYFPSFSCYANYFSSTKNLPYPCFPSSAPPLNIFERLLLILIRLTRTRLKNRHRLSTKIIVFFLKCTKALPWVQTTNISVEIMSSKDKQPHIIMNQFHEHKSSFWICDWGLREKKITVDHQEAIRRFFTPTPEILKKVQEFIDQQRSENTCLVGVHLRRGDYSKWANGKYFFTDQEIVKILKQLQTSHSSNKFRFLLFSNESINTKNYLDLDIVSGLGDAILDLYALASCQYIIGPPSTFTMWASFYGKVPMYCLENTTSQVEISDFKINEAC